MRHSPSRLAILATLAATVLLGPVGPAVAQTPIAAGSVVVLRVGDGTTTLANTGNSFSVLAYNATGTVQQTIPVTSSGTAGLQLSGTATSEGSLSLSPDGTTLSFGGYNPGATGFTGTGSLPSRTSAQAPRAYGTVNVGTGTYSFGQQFTGTGTDFSTNNIRAVYTPNSTGFYAAGGNSGTVLAPSTAIQTTATNTRVLGSFGGDLYFSTASGTAGIYRIPGTPTAGPNTATAFLTGVTGQGTSPYGFVFSPDGLTLYVADDGAAVAGVQKFTRPNTASAFGFAYNITGATGATDVSVDFSGANPVVYAVNPANLYRFTDAGSTGAFTSIATAGTNFAFRELEFTPVPEPATVLLGAAAGLGAVRLLRRRATRAVVG